MDKENKKPYNVFFVADLHISHKNILYHSPNRVSCMNLQDSNDIDGHDKYVLNLFKEQTKRGDHIYILGDFIMANKDKAEKILNEIKSNGCQLHLIVGNHDKSSIKLTNYFESVSLIKDVIFKKSVYSFLNEDFEIVMCHYPLKSWNNKCRGSLNMYGHVHNNATFIDEELDLCLNVGLDNPMLNYKLISLEDVYNYYTAKLNGIEPKDYSNIISEKNDKYIR